MPHLAFADFRTRFEALAHGLSWEALGFYMPGDRIYSFGTDTKVLSTVFEALVEPLLTQVADEYDYAVEGSVQTVYPDFTLTPSLRSGPGAVDRIAIDVKTTYRRFNARGRPGPFRYTLGSYTSFLRSPGAAKNIHYPYAEYEAHWVIGFLYTRSDPSPARVVSVADAAELDCPYRDVDYFVQEKYKIVGLTPASGNTANIGSLAATSLEPFREGAGPFADVGKEICDDYWRNYPRSRSDREYSSVPEFIAWRAARRDS